MFNLDQSIREWRNALRRNEAMEDADLMEMESFLRDEIDRQMAAGLGPEAAFRAAAARSASAEDLGREYGKFRFHQKRYPFWHPARFMPAMTWSYVKVAVRKMRKQKAYAFINVAGLAAGMFACILIFLWVHHDLSYDRFHSKADRIYRLVVEDSSGAKARLTAGVPAPLGPALAAEVPEVEAYARVQSGWDWPLHKGDGQFYNEERLAGVDPGFFEMFDFPAAAGDPRSIFQGSSRLLISEDLGRKFFGDQDPIGKNLKIYDEDWKVDGVLKRIPRNSHFDFAFVMPLAEIAKRRDGRLDDWKWNQVATYLLLRPGARIRDIEAKSLAVLKKNLPEAKVRLSLQPLKDVHLRSSAIDAWMVVYPNPGRIAYVYILSLTAACILILACLNYFSLSTARFQARIREVGMRKIFGAGRSDLFRQFLGESALFAFLAFLIAVSAAAAVLPAFGVLLQKDLALFRAGGVSAYAGLLIIFAITCLLAGVGPALFMSALRPDRLSGDVGRSGSPGKSRWRKLLVVVQFAATISLLVFTLTVTRQLRFIQTKDKGFEPSSLISLTLRFTTPESWQAWRTEALRNPDLLGAAKAGFPMDAAERSQSGGIDWEGKDPGRTVDFARLNGDEGMLSLFRMTLREGRSFSGDSAADRNNWLLNETAAAAMGLANPVGRWLSVNGRKGIIIGVVKDFNFGSLHNLIAPRIIGYGGMYVGVRYRPGKTAEVLAFLKGLNDRFFPNTPFQYSLIEDTIQRWYAVEHRAGALFRGFTLLTIAIACLGLLGLASFMAERRTKEIGIRKVLGASVSGILWLQSRQLLSWVLLANAFAWPVGYLFARSWLKSFAYRVDLKIGLFLFSAGLALILTLATVAFQSLRAAKADPVQCLRYE